jgi:predicted metal-dependent enzyme (double-stranded beta helix superfamily)
MSQTLHATDPGAIPVRAMGGIGELGAEIGAACDGPPDAMKRRVMAALRRAASQPGLLNAEHRRPSTESYARHVIYADPAGRFTILAIVWGPGQFSVPHAHHTWCAYALCDRPLRETLYAWNHAAERAEALRTEVRHPGYCCYADAGLDQIHRLGNPGAEPAVSIHVYGVERACIGTHVNRPVETATSV